MDGRTETHEGGLLVKGRSRIGVLTLAIGLLPVAALGLLGCESGTTTSSASTTTASSESTTPVTGISRPVELTWTPAESPTPADQAQLADALRFHGLHFLLPSTPPVAAPGLVSAQFMLWETVPTKEISLELVARRGDEANPLIAVQSRVGNPPGGAGETQAVRVRGQVGQAHVSSGTVSMLDWQESGQNYHAEWVGLSLAQVIAWLETWRTVP
jgi:hypothetical protein